MDPGSSSGVECPLYNGHCKKAGDMGINLHEPEAWPNLSPDPIGKVYPMAYDLLDLGSSLGLVTY